MPKRLQIIPGQKFNRWTVLEEVDKDSSKHRRVKVRCDCGTEATRKYSTIKHEQSKSCGCLKKEKIQTGPSNPNWKGGRHIDEGYVLVYDKNHPHAKSNGYVREHRKVMSDYLKRPLSKDENVHHINGDKQDNRLENLELWSTSQPSGQKVQDKLDWAYMIIKKYGELK